MRHGFGNLVVALGDIGGTADVADIAHLQRFAQIHAELEVVGRVQRRDPANPLRPEARSGAVGGPDIEGHAQERHVVLADLAHILEIRRLEERIDAGPMRQLSALEATDLGLVLDGVHALEAELLSAADLLLPLPERDLFFFSQGSHSLQFLEIGESAGVFAMAWCVGFVEGHVWVNCKQKPAWPPGRAACPAHAEARQFPPPGSSG